MRDRRALKRVLAACGSLVLVGAIAAPVAGGCFGRECEGDAKTFDGGSLIDPDTYQTTAVDDAWLQYTHQRIWLVNTSLLGARPIDWVMIYVSADPKPNSPSEPSNSSLASGNLGEILQLRGGDCGVNGWSSCLTIKNDTCSDFYVRVVVHAGGPRPDAGTTSDASTDSNTSDAARDVSIDAPTDAPTE